MRPFMPHPPPENDAATSPHTYLWRHSWNVDGGIRMWLGYRGRDPARHKPFSVFVFHFSARLQLCILTLPIALRCQCYWVEEQEYKAGKKPKGQIDLSGCSLATGEQHTKRMNTFGLFHTHRRDYFLEARNRNELMHWVTNIEGILGVKEEGVGMNDFELTTVVGKGGYGKVRVCEREYFLPECTTPRGCGFFMDEMDFAAGRKVAAQSHRARPR